MKCSKCYKEATRRLSPDFDIAGIPVCNSYDCELLIRIELLIMSEEQRNSNIKK